MNTQKPSYRKVRQFLDQIDSAVIPTDSVLAQQARNVFSKDDAFAFSREAYAGPAVVLVRPYASQNIGSVARSMLNFGLTELRIVQPRDGWLNRDALECASGAREVLEHAQVYDELSDAVADTHLVLATTARFRDSNKPEPLVPSEAAARVSETISAGYKVAILFGSERNGLSNEEVDVAHELVAIPSNMMFGSLNLSHAVMVIAYEVWLSLMMLGLRKPSRTQAEGGEGLAAVGELGARGQPSEAGSALETSAGTAAAARAPGGLQRVAALTDSDFATSAGDATSPLATSRETEALLSRIRAGLSGSPKFPDERVASIFPKLRNMLLRVRPSAAEVRLMHGVVRALFDQPAKLGEMRGGTAAAEDGAASDQAGEASTANSERAASASSKPADVAGAGHGRGRGRITDP